MTIESLDEKALNELRVIIEEMTENAVSSREKKEQAFALGLPRNRFVRLINKKAANDDFSVDEELADMRSVVEKNHGKDAYNDAEVRNLLGDLVLLEQEIGHYRKVIKRFDVDNFAINKLVEIKSHSPLDQGKGLLREIFKLAGRDENVVENQAANDSSQHVKDDAKAEAQDSLWKSKRQLIVDAVLGISLGVVAIKLLV